MLTRWLRAPPAPLGTRPHARVPQYAPSEAAEGRLTGSERPTGGLQSSGSGGSVFWRVGPSVGQATVWTMVKGAGVSGGVVVMSGAVGVVMSCRERSGGVGMEGGGVSSSEGPGISMLSVVFVGDFRRCKGCRGVSGSVERCQEVLGGVGRCRECRELMNFAKGCRDMLSVSEDVGDVGRY